MIGSQATANAPENGETSKFNSLRLCNLRLDSRLTRETSTVHIGPCSQLFAHDICPRHKFLRLSRGATRHIVTTPNPLRGLHRVHSVKREPSSVRWVVRGEALCEMVRSTELRREMNFLVSNGCDSLLEACVPTGQVLSGAEVHRFKLSCMIVKGIQVYFIRKLVH